MGFECMAWLLCIIHIAALASMTLQSHSRAYIEAMRNGCYWLHSI